MNNFDKANKYDVALAACAVQDAMGDKFAIMTGNETDGFHAIGPFPDLETATRFAEMGRREVYIMRLHTPKLSKVL